MQTELSSSTRRKSPAKNFLDIVAEIGPVLSQHVDEEENNRRLSDQTVNLLKETGLFKLFLPMSLGGFEVDPLSTAKTVEAVARYNTAAAWSLMVGNTSSWWCSRLPDKGIEEMYNNGPDTLMAGAFHPPMKAIQVEGGYIINGRSPLTSNVHEAQWIFVTAFVMENGQMKMNNGMPVMVGVVMKAEDCKILDTWYTIGMRATDSNDIEAIEVFVPDHLSFSLIPEFIPNSHYKGLLYQYPAIGASIACLIAPVALAVARNAIQELKSLAEKKVPFASTVPIRDRGVIQRKLGMAEALVQSNRAYLFNEITSCWNKTLAGEKISLEERASLLLAVTHTNQCCVQAVDLMYSAAGTSGIYLKNKLAHCFADAHVISQHGFSNESRYETAGQINLGLQPDLPVIVF